MPAQPLSGLDMAFLCLDDPGMPMTMGALALFAPESPVHPQRVAELLAARAERIGRLRESPRSSRYPVGGAEWVADPAFSAARHVHAHLLRGRERELTDLVAEIMARRLDRSRPLWEAHVMSGLPRARFALLLKLHHALADGAGAAALAAGLLDGFEPGPRPAPSTPPLAADLRSAWQAITRPSRLSGLARGAWDSAGIVAQVLRAARPAVALGALVATPGDARRLATVRVNRDDVLRVRKIHGGTTNDVVLAVLTGAVRDCLRARGLPLADRQVRALVPVSVRKRAAGRDSGNHLSGYLCELPVAEADPVAQLREVRARMDARKAAGAARGPGAIPLLAGRVPTVLHRLAGPVLRRSAPLLFDTVITNVPVPDVPWTLDGAELEELYPIVPLAHGVVFTAAIAAYRNYVHIALQTPAGGEPDVSELAAATPRALAALHRSISDVRDRR